MVRIQTSLGLLLMAIACNAQVTSGLVAQFEFNGNTSDNKGGANAKQYNCTYVADRSGNPASAIYMKGAVNSFINLGNSGTIKPTVGSVSLWLNADAVNNLGSGYDYNPILLAKNNASKTSYMEGYSLYMKRGDQKLIALTTRESNGAERFVWSNNAISLDNWYHAVFCYNYDSLWFYVNNTLQGRVSRTFDQVFANGDSVLMGASKVSSNDRYFNGAVDDVRIYKRILTAAQVDSLYKSPALSTRNPKALSNKTLLFPNPSTNTVYFSSEVSATDIMVYDFTGKLLFQKAKAISLDFEGRKGLFLVQYKDQLGNFHSERIVVE